MISGKLKSQTFFDFDRDKQFYGRLFKSIFYEDWMLIKFNPCLWKHLTVCDNDYSLFSILCPIYISVFLPGYFSMATQRDPIPIEIFDLDNNELHASNEGSRSRTLESHSQLVNTRSLSFSLRNQRKTLCKKIYV